jgi:hypothetical protein
VLISQRGIPMQRSRNLSFRVSPTTIKLLSLSEEAAVLPPLVPIQTSFLPSPLLASRIPRTAVSSPDLEERPGQIKADGTRRDLLRLVLGEDLLIRCSSSRCSLLRPGRAERAIRVVKQEESEGEEGSAAAERNRAGMEQGGAERGSRGVGDLYRVRRRCFKGSEAEGTKRAIETVGVQGGGGEAADQCHLLLYQAWIRSKKSGFYWSDSFGIHFYNSYI